MLHYTSQAPSHPGSYLQELLLWRQVSAREFGDVTGIGESKVVDIIKRRRAIDKNVSEGLAAYFGNSSGFWLDLQAHFDQRQSGDHGARGGVAVQSKGLDINARYS